MAELDVQVLIVGGGGAGLTASMLLSKLGVDTLLVSALPTTSVLPKAHLLNQRSMEILDDAGVADAIYEIGTPRRHMAKTGFYAGFAGWPDAGRTLGIIDSWGGGGSDLDWEAASPKCSANLPQIRLEPLMKAHAESLAPDMVRFGHEVISLTQDSEGVTLVVRERESGREYEVRSRYVFACDGGRFVGPSLDVQYEGLREAGSVVSIHMSADLSQWARDPEVLIRWIWLPHMSKMATLVPMGPTNWGPSTEEWVFHLSYTDEDPRKLSDDEVEADMRRALGIGEHPVQIHMITRWELMGVVASKLRVDNVFILGDAAHRHPPTGGLGLTSATQDVHNLCWKVAHVLSGTAGEGLLASYEPERRPSVQWNVDNSLTSALNHIVIGDTLELVDPTQPPEVAWAKVARMWGSDPADDDYRERVRCAIASQTQEFRKLNVEYGYVYDSDAIVPDGSDPAPNPDPTRIYVPSTRPGSPLPHAWVTGRDGCRVSTLDLVRPGRFVVIASPGSSAWIDAARSVAARYDLPLDALTIGHLAGDYLDLECSWLRHRGIDDDGAILVRPDRFVAWRSRSGSPTCEDDLRRALESVLARAL
jgi:2,4-dichlorophenol 6-monooxygenase